MDVQEESVFDPTKRYRLSRRSFVLSSAGLGSALLLQACGGASAPSPTAAAAPTQAPAAAPTQAAAPPTATAAQAAAPTATTAPAAPPATVAPAPTPVPLL